MCCTGLIGGREACRTVQAAVIMRADCQYTCAKEKKEGTRVKIFFLLCRRCLLPAMMSARKRRRFNQHCLSGLYLSFHPRRFLNELAQLDAAVALIFFRIATTFINVTQFHLRRRISVTQRTKMTRENKMCLFWTMVVIGVLYRDIIKKCGH